MKAAWLVVLCGLLFGVPGYTQTSSIGGSDTLDILRNLTPEQQEAILQQVTGGSSATGNSAGGADSDGQRRQVRDDIGNAQNERRRNGSGSQKEEEPLIPVLKPEDSVLIQIDKQKRRFVPAPQQPGTTAQSLQQLGANGVAIPQQAGEWVDPPRLTPEEERRQDALIALVQSRNPYPLDANGTLALPGFRAIALAGLTEMQATQRLSAEPELMKLDIKLIRLPLAKSGLKALKRFGYDLFDEAPSTFSPVTDIPIPADYIIGAGDELGVQLYGNQNRTLRLTVGRDGRLNLPGIGPVNVGGQTFSSVKTDLEARVERQMIGVRASVGMGDVRSIRVFVLGEANRPGSYTVSGLATITSALFASGGVKPIGSLRDIQLKRQGVVVRHLDLYDLLIRGDTGSDTKLLPGDAIFIPPVGFTVTIDGEVHRPAVYELRDEKDVSDLVRMAGGLTPDADASRASITRVDEQSQRIVVSVALNAPTGSSVQGLRNGDVLRVPALRPTLDSGVTVSGAVHRPGPFAWREGMRLSDVISSVDELRPNADQGYLVIRRELSPDRRVAVLSADLNAALAARGSDADVLLMPRDQITVFDLEPGRERVIKPIMDELRLQSALDRPTEVVRVEGKVKVPGEYPLEPHMRISDLIRAGGNLESAAYGGKAELARYRVVNGDSRRTELVEIDLAAVRRGDPNENVELQPYDYLLIKETPDWGDQESVLLEGEVRFPGVYPIRRGETMHQVLIRAGGVTTLAFPRGAAFTRKELKEREQKQLDMLTERLKGDVATLSLQAAAANQAGASSALTAGQSLLTQLENAEAVGRLVIDLPGILASDPTSEDDVVLKDGDRLVVPTQRQEVTVIGEVQSVTSHLYRNDLGRDDYIALSGGTTRKADRDKIYVVRTDGSVVASNRSLFRRSYDVAIMPGDTIVVPLNTERIPRLPFWQAVTQIVYNLAVSVAAINSF